MNIAYFITPHGFGHASRACAVMSAIYQKEETIHFDIFTSIPEWFFSDSLKSDQFTYHPMIVDIGLVQETSLAINLARTISQLNQFLPFSNKNNMDMIDLLKNNKAQWIFCDISPLGIYLANQLKIPCVLIENFTWDWIYQGYSETESGFIESIRYYSQIYQLPDYHIQTQPICNPSLQPAFVSDPVSREPRQTREQIRKRLGILDSDRMVLITMGGIQTDFSFLNKRIPERNVLFVVPGMEAKSNFPENIIPLPHHSDFFHPDLINACDLVVGKVGYSTLAEVYYAGKPFVFIPRVGFRESPVLEKFIEEKLVNVKISEMDFFQGNWFVDIDRLLDIDQNVQKKENGAIQIANYFLKYL